MSLFSRSPEGNGGSLDYYREDTNMIRGLGISSRKAWEITPEGIALFKEKHPTITDEHIELATKPIGFNTPNH